MRITSKGQVTIPKEIRDRSGLVPGAEVEFSLDDGIVTLTATQERGTELVEQLRRHRDDFTMTTEEIMALTRGEN